MRVCECFHMTSGVNHNWSGSQRLALQRVADQARLTNQTRVLHSVQRLLQPCPTMHRIDSALERTLLAGGVTRG